jgi:ribosome-binding protein aMBF1 (putative translation factor)
LLAERFMARFMTETARPVVVASAPRTEPPCRVCGCSARRVHGRYERHVADLPWHGLSVALRVRVRELREARGWSQRELARRAAVRPATIVAIQNGQTTGIDFDVLERLADAHRVDASFLVVHERSGGRRGR